ncbi:MAG: NYN domain-containing protein [Rhizobiales bacterium]|nr:NYN domain-containing protein [Hyphomicrobiales bacterium]
MTQTNAPRIALFIDAENASAKDTKKIFDYCAGLDGRIAIARCFGHLSSLKTWEKAMIEHHIVPVMTPPWANKANASDFALTIDAVSLMQRQSVDILVIASSDADFAQLAVFAANGDLRFMASVRQEQRLQRGKLMGIFMF